MMNITSLGYSSVLQKPQNLLTHQKLNEGQSLQLLDKNSRLDTLKLTASESLQSTSLNTPDKLTIEGVPRSMTIAIETLKSAINNVDEALEKADGLNLSFGERLDFLKNEGKKWVDDIKQNDPEMFVQWLKMNKEKIMSGDSELAHLPPDFTMKDYYSYVKEPFSALA